MKHTPLTSPIIYLTLLLGLSTINVSANNEDRFRIKVNLALRQTAHNLLLSQNDSTSQIPPVQYKGSNGFLLKIEQPINYDTLPFLLNLALKDYNITQPYEVSVLDCEDETLFLGYNNTALDKENVACQGRELTGQCANIFIQFDINDDTAFSQLIEIPKWISIPIIAGLLFLLYYKITRPTKSDKLKGRLHMGRYYYDPKNQTLINGDEKINLTFRENKLLHLFASQPNKVLTRSEIMSVVWEDEGVIVGRSLDVFISRLRKLLNQDPSIQLKNVHGVGYRLEFS